MRKLHEFVEESKYIIALENEGFDSVESYRNELFDCVMYRFESITPPQTSVKRSDSRA